MIILKNIEKNYKKKILKNINYTFEKNNIYLITGDMGSGKSTLLKLVLGIEKISSGEIEHNFKNIDFAYNEPREYIYPNITVEANLELYRSLFKTEDVHYNNIVNIFELEDIKKELIRDLSSGNKKKVSLACSLLNDNMKVILLDEPLTNLDKKTINRLSVFLNSIKEDKIIIITSHQFEEIMNIVDKHIDIQNKELCDIK